MNSIAVPQDWTEEDSEGQFCVRFDGHNADLKDDLEAENFAQGVKAPAAEDKGGLQYARTRRARGVAMTPMMAVGFVIGCVFAVGFQFVVDAITGTVFGRSSSGDTVRVLGGLIAFFVGSASPHLVQLLRRERAKPVSRSSNESFSLVLAQGALRVRGSLGTEKTYQLDAMRGFDGAMGKLSVVYRDGRKERLPCLLPQGRHDQLAARLTEVLVSKFATVYR